MGDPARILIVDDDAAVTNFLTVFLMQTERYEPVVTNDSRRVPALLESERPDLVLLDMDMPGLSGIDILRHIHDRGVGVPVIVLTGVSDIDLAVKAMKLGAFDYLTKPADDEMLLDTMDRALEHGALSRSLERLPDDTSREELSDPEAFEPLISNQPSLRKIFLRAEMIAAGDSPVLIHGEHGTGKEALARAIHRASRRREGPFTAFDAAAVPSEALPGELFGMVRDFSGSQDDRPGFLEAASGGTLFLDSIELLSPQVQTRLRRVMQNGEFYRERSAEFRTIDLRLVVSTAVDLDSDEYRESFSRDLLYHLMVNSLEIPPLKEHPSDIPPLAGHFARQAAERAGRAPVNLSAPLLAALSQYDFPGNVEELESIVGHCILNTRPGIEPGPESLPPFTLVRMMGAGARTSFVPSRLDEVISQYVARTLAHFGGDAEQASAALGLTVEELGRLLANGGGEPVTPP